MWKIVMSKRAEEELHIFLKHNFFTREDINVLKMWVAFVEEHGPRCLEDHYKWDDHPLTGKLKGYRSSCISNSGRIIYIIKDHEITVEVIRITPNHNYRFNEEF